MSFDDETKEKFYLNVFYDKALHLGDAEEAREIFRGMFPEDYISDEDLKLMAQRYRASQDVVQPFMPVIEKEDRRHWYAGATLAHPTWAAFRKRLEEKGWPEEQIDGVDKSSNVIVDLTPDPSGKGADSARGLVVGFIQSGKTTNFTAVTAKLADLDYRMVIVLAGIHNALRSQTQARLDKDLNTFQSTKWFNVTDDERDFDLISLNGKESHKMDAGTFLNSAGKCALLVVKKNATVLKKVNKWLSTPAARDALKNNRVLVIDDEADQASIGTATINPLIRDMLSLMPKSTYVAYTATPFANVFIDPRDESDLYPRDFIVPLPQPEGYFGPEQLFGRDDADGDDVEGLDMVRIIPAETESLLRPETKDDVDGFQPQRTKEFDDAIHWFVLATAARWLRARRSADFDEAGVKVNSSMLIHTTHYTAAHDSFRQPIQAVLNEMRSALSNGDSGLFDRLRTQWVNETEAVDAGEWGREPESFDELIDVAREVIDDTRIIIDNYRSEDRLHYETDARNTVIAIGGNTLSRGITLEGLVSSFFLRPSRAYDTLLQMGRWFGFRNGYEDLTRLWTTSELISSFRHLALVEHEMREDMRTYEIQQITPMDAAVRIRTHPSLAITAKMGAAQPQRVSYSGARVQQRYLERADAEVLADNWQAGETLVSAASSQGVVEKDAASGTVIRGVMADAVLAFLDSFTFPSKQTDMERGQMSKYIRSEIASENPALTTWNVAVISGSGRPVKFAGEELKSVIRTPFKGDGAVGDIKTLMSKADLVVDCSSLSRSEASKMEEAALTAYRMKDEETAGRGLVVLYPIDPESKPQSERSARVREPLAAADWVLGVALVFPRTGRNPGEDSVRATHVAVELQSNWESTTDEESAAIYGSEI